MKNKLLSLVFHKNLLQKKSKKFFYYGIFDEKLKKKIKNLNYIIELNDKYCPKETIGIYLIVRKFTIGFLKNLVKDLTNFIIAHFRRKSGKLFLEIGYFNLFVLFSESIRVF